MDNSSKSMFNFNINICYVYLSIKEGICIKYLPQYSYVV